MIGSPTAVKHYRILIIDDTAAIHHDFRKVLSADAELSAKAALESLEADILGESTTVSDRPNFEIHSAHQGQDGVAMAREALIGGHPYAMAFVDMRMPPGWDGLETIKRLWDVDPDLQVAICSAHSDYDWMDVVARLGHADKLLIIKKPFEIIEIIQCASALTRKWQNERILRSQVQTLEQAVSTHTEGLDIANRT